MRSETEIISEIEELGERDLSLLSYDPTEAYNEGFLDALKWVLEVGRGS